MAKKVKKKIRIRILPIIIIIFILTLLSGSVYLLSLIPIKNIYISGNNYLKDQEIIELAKIENYPSFLKTRTKDMKKNIKKSPYVKSVTIKKKILGIVEIQIEEYNILFRKEENNKIVLEDKEELIDNEKYQVPILLNYIPDTKYDSFIKGMNQVTPSIKNQISEIRYYPNTQDEDRFLLYMNDGNYVYLTLTKFKQINYYEDVLEKLDGKKGILYLDSGNHFKIME
ncbi:FtsQ-type POTRA domain-containing protein [bacterium]|nr:FtsQ-type POTRA domain-containing protein [bacterium]